MTRPAFLLATFLAPAVPAAEPPWRFGEPVLLEDGTAAGWHQHLDGAGRRHVAASGSDVAVVWESDRDGAPQIWIARRPRDGREFDVRRLSDGEEAYEPAIAAVADGVHVAAWEQDGAIHARVVRDGRAGPSLRLSGGEARQVTLASGNGRIAAVWAAVDGRERALRAVELSLQGDRLHAGTPVPVAPVTEHAFQAYPSAWIGPDGALSVAWEDRRAGHTRIYHARRDAGGRFSEARSINEHNSPAGSAGEPLRLGSGVMRVSLAGEGSTLRALWLDKRNPGSGYAVWGAASEDGGRGFGPNERVQDAGGDAVPQWHAGIAAGGGLVVAAWDDGREGWSGEEEPGDVLLSWWAGGAWSEDLLVPGASGPGYSGSPSVALGPTGDLHLAWIEREGLKGPTRLRYLHGRRAR